MLTLIYTLYYPRSESDIFRYFDDSEVLYEALIEHPSEFFKMMFGYKDENSEFFQNYYINTNHWDRKYNFNLYNDSHTIISLNTLIRLISFGVFHVHTLIFSLFSMIGLTAIYRVVKQHFPNKQNALLICIFLIPSVVFWSSGVLKEAVLLFELGIFLFALNNVLMKKRIVLSAVFSALFLFLLIFIKPYVLFVLVPVILAWAINQYWQIKKSFITYFIVITIGSLAAFNIEKVVPKYNFKITLAYKQKDFIGLANYDKSGSQFELTKIEPSFLGIVKVVPEALANCFIRPIPSKKTSALQWVSVFENLLFIGLILLAIISFIKTKTIPDGSKNLFWLGITFTLILFTIIGLTTPVAGALVRYKVPALPFLAMALLLVIDLEWMIKKIPLLKILR